MKRDELPAAASTTVTAPDTGSAPGAQPVAGPASASASTAALMHRPAGTHLLADLGGIAAEKLCSCAALDALLRTAAEAANARVLHSHFHGFGDGQGVTGVLLLAESHISIHTWPECGFAAADIFMCGNAQPELALAIIETALQPSSRSVNAVHRAPPSR